MASYAGDRTQSKGADHRIHCAVFQRDTLSGQVKKFNVQLCLALLLLCEANHSRVGFEGVKLADVCRIVALPPYIPELDFATF